MAKEDLEKETEEELLDENEPDEELLDENEPDEELLEEFKEAQEEYNEVISESEQQDDEITEGVEEDNTENNKNKTDNQKKKITIWSIVIIAVIAIIVLLCIVFKKSDDVKYVSEASEVEKHNEEIASLPDETKNIMGINKNKSTSDEISEKIKKQNEEKKITKEYKEYEKLSDKEKKKQEVVPPKEKSQYDNPDDLKKDIDYDDGKLPKKYNLKDKIKIKVENQDGYGLCWDFASVKSLETNYALINKKNKDFSEMHVDYLTSNKFYGDRDLHDGGNFVNFEHYSSLNFGPVLENKVEYKDYGNNYDFMTNLEPELNVVKTVRFPNVYKEEDESEEAYYKRRTENINLFKQHIKQYGSIYAVIQAPDSGTEYFNDKNSCLYYDYKDNNYIETRGPHAISIVGWDDSFSKNKFNSKLRPKHDGAFIALNSWGNDYHEKGYFYISYDDIDVLNNAAGVVSTDLKDAIRIDDISNKTIKNLMLKEAGYNVIKKDGKEYVTDVALSGVNEVDLSNTDVTDEDLKYLSKFSNLGRLKLNNTNISDISEIIKLRELYSLNISNTKVSNLAGIEKMSNLNELFISNTEVSDITPLSGIKNIFNLDISKTKVTDVSALRNTNLSFLVANNLSGINGINFINKLTDLEAKNSNLDISTVSGLELNSLNISNNNMDGVYINLPKTAGFTCENCNITSLNNLKFGDGINYVDLKDNQLSSLEGIENLKGVSTLDLTNNKNIKDYSSINNIINNDESSNNEEQDTVNKKKIFQDTIEKEKVNAVSVNYEITYTQDQEMLIVEKTKENNKKDYSFYNIVDGKINKLLSLDDVLSANIYYNYIENKFSVVLEQEDKYDFGDITFENDNVQYTSNFDMNKEDFEFDYYNSSMLESYEISAIQFENNIRILNYNTIGPKYNNGEFSLTLDDNDITDLKEIGKLNVSYLSLAKNKKLTNIDKLVNVKNLNLTDCNISSLDEVSKLNNLHTLDLSDNSITDISSLNKLDNLKDLSLSNNKKITGDIKLGLQMLNVSDCDLENLKAFNLDDMTFINISGNDGLKDNLTELRDLGNLYVLAENMTLKYSDFVKLSKCKGNNCSYINEFNVKYDSSKISNNKISIKEDSLKKYLLRVTSDLGYNNIYLEPKVDNLSIIDSSKESSISGLYTNYCSIKKLIFE